MEILDILQIEGTFVSYDVLEFELDELKEKLKTSNDPILESIRDLLIKRLESMKLQVNEGNLTELKYKEMISNKIKDYQSLLIKDDGTISNFQQAKILLYIEIMNSELDSLEGKNSIEEQTEEVRKLLEAVKEVEIAINQIRLEQSSFGDKMYWEREYQKSKTPFEWYLSYSDLRDILATLTSKGNKILIIGCGNSTLGEEMWIDGYRSLENIDYSSTVIQKMIHRTKEQPELFGLNYKVMDVFEMTYPNDEFELVLDKGTLDAILCGENEEDAGHLLFKEVHRILAPGGRFFLISLSPPFRLLPMLDLLKWKIEHESFKTRATIEDVCFRYIFTK